MRVQVVGAVLIALRRRSCLCFWSSQRPFAHSSAACSQSGSNTLASCLTMFLVALAAMTDPVGRFHGEARGRPLPGCRGSRG